MRYLRLFIILFTVSVLTAYNLVAQSDSLALNQDSVNNAILSGYKEKLIQIELQRRDDSVKKVELQNRINALKTTDNLKKEELQKKIDELNAKEANRVALKKAQIDSLRLTARGYPVFGPLGDTLFMIYTRIGASTPQDRAQNITSRIRKLADDDFLKTDSITTVEGENTYDVIYRDMIIMSVSESDAIWNNKSKAELAADNAGIIRKSIIAERQENKYAKLLIRIGLALSAIIVGWLIFWLINKAYSRIKIFIVRRKETWLHDLYYRDYTFLTIDQELQIIVAILNIIKWFLIVLFFYLLLPVVFSIFPFTRGWASNLLHLVWSPVKDILLSVWNYLPNVFTILVIFFVMRYFIKVVKYFFTEIETEKLKISGFHADWAIPTFGIVRFLLYAFMFIMIFPYLPGSDSTVFRGVSVFLGILFSLGSSSAIANIIAGLVITYMRPFRIGDRIKLGEISGDVIEKTMLVTRLRTIKNEEITIPNSSILTGNTLNYSTFAKTEGLIIHTAVTIGYDVPWKDMHQALIDAALLTEFILKDPKPFVLQTSLDDFYVSYQVNAYTKEPSRQAVIYSELHRHIQDICNERNIEILSPHFRAIRDGNTMNIPASYLPPDYKASGLRVDIGNKEGK